MEESPTQPAHADVEALVLEHLAAGYNLARWFLRNPHDAEDAVQDACIRALRGTAGYAGGNRKAWFLMIVRNVCLTRLRHATSPKVVRLDDVVT
jgi:RNA polymerase sigma-70 factor (ECF subfamily)